MYLAHACVRTPGSATWHSCDARLPAPHLGPTSHSRWCAGVHQKCGQVGEGAACVVCIAMSITMVTKLNEWEAMLHGPLPVGMACKFTIKNLPIATRVASSHLMSAVIINSQGDASPATSSCAGRKSADDTWMTCRWQCSSRIPQQRRCRMSLCWTRRCTGSHSTTLRRRAALILLTPQAYVQWHHAQRCDWVDDIACGACAPVALLSTILSHICSQLWCSCRHDI